MEKKSLFVSVFPSLTMKWMPLLCTYLKSKVFIMSTHLLQERHQELQKREEPTKCLLEKGQEFIDACPPEDVVQISDRMKKLKDLWNDTKDRAQKRKVMNDCTLV